MPLDSPTVHGDKEDPSSHQMVVDKVTKALLLQPPGENSMKQDDSDMEPNDPGDSDSGMELEDDMSLLQFQGEIKREALTSRDSSKTGSQPKKGRKSLNP